MASNEEKNEVQKSNFFKDTGKMFAMLGSFVLIICVLSLILLAVLYKSFEGNATIKDHIFCLKNKVMSDEHFAFDEQAEKDVLTKGLEGLKTLDVSAFKDNKEVKKDNFSYQLEGNTVSVTVKPQMITICTENMPWSVAKSANKNVAPYTLSASVDNLADIKCEGNEVICAWANQPAPAAEVTFEDVVILNSQEDVNNQAPAGEVVNNEVAVSEVPNN